MHIFAFLAPFSFSSAPPPPPLCFVLTAALCSDCVLNIGAVPILVPFIIAVIVMGYLIFQVEVVEGEFLNNFFRVTQYEMAHMWKKWGKVPDKNE